MERLFIYVFIGLVLFSGILFWFFRRFFVEEESERNFTSGNSVDDDGYIQSAPREVAVYEERQSSIVAAAVRKAPKTIMTTIFIQLFLMMFTGYLSVQNIERLAMAGSALSQGDYGLAVSALWPIGKEAGVEQYRVARGTNPYLDENNLIGFAYIGKLDGKKVAVMDHLYSVQDRDESLSIKDESYGTVIKGLTADKAKDICDDQYNGELISQKEWDLSRSHFLAARNVKEYSDIPEWTRDVSAKDTDDFFVIAKESGVWELAEKEDIDREEGGYIDGDDLLSAGFRCSITWN
ncbi:hypothetical protein KAR91_79000 [Candidatus Pacearchaeota archaeon]|nr:hypothetical protein [Candidatus Pacearchaeota archaeon]